jgi:hypothetical protein
MGKNVCAETERFDGQAIDYRNCACAGSARSGAGGKATLPRSGPPSPGNSQGSHGKSAPKVTYVLAGSLSNYTSVGATSGAVTIMITHANHRAKTLVNPQSPLSLRIIVAWDTKVVMHRGATTIANGDRGVVKVRVPKNTPAASLATTLTKLPTVASQVIDQGPAS